MKMKLMALLMVLAMLVGAVSVAMADETNKTLTVEPNGTYATIQAAIDYIDTQADKTEWTIIVKEGTYPRFTVLDDMDNLTVTADKNSEGKYVAAVIEVCNNSDAPAATSGGFPNTAGVSIRQANNVTINGLTFEAGTQTDPWYSAAVSNYSESSVKGNNPIITNCTFNGSGASIAVFINTGTPNFVVSGNTFDGFKEAISMYGDGTLMKEATVTYNKMTNCSFAIHGYYGGTPSEENPAGVLTFAYNEVSGSDGLRSKLVIQDQVNGGSIKADVHSNTFENVLVGLVNMREEGETVSNVLSANTIKDNCFYVEAIEPGTIDLWSTYNALVGDFDSTGKWVGDYGMWVRLGVTFEEYTGWYKSYLNSSYKTAHWDEFLLQFPDDPAIKNDENKDARNAAYNAAFADFFDSDEVQTALAATYEALSNYINNAIKNSNAVADGKLSITGLENLNTTSEHIATIDPAVAELCKEWEILIPTFTWFKDGIYWESLPTPTPIPTATRKPTPTPVPTATPSPTPDMSDLPETGDNTNLELFAVLLVMSFAGLTLLLRKRSA